MSTSALHGIAGSWRTLPIFTKGHKPAIGTGGQPLVQPNGRVIVPILGIAKILAFTSIDGGASWTDAITVLDIFHHTVAGKLREEPLPSAEIDPFGKVYIAWSDCRFEPNCSKTPGDPNPNSANDIVFSTSVDGKTWSGVQLVKIDPTGMHIDHFIQGLAV